MQMHVVNLQRWVASPLFDAHGYTLMHMATQLGVLGKEYWLTWICGDTVEVQRVGVMGQKG